MDASVNQASWDIGPAFWKGVMLEINTGESEGIWKLEDDYESLNMTAECEDVCHFL
jgi:hypothetical protein